MKKLSLLLAVMMSVMVILTACDSNPDSDYDDGAMREGLTAMQVSEEMGIGINLGNTMEAYDATDCESESYTWMPTVGDNTPTDYETCWGAVETTKEAIQGMKDCGFNTVRIPVFWGNMMENDGEYKINEEYIGRVKEIVDYCRSAEVYCVINMHHFDEFIIRRHTLEECEEIFENVWTQIAEYFKDYSDYLVFEGYNEYLGGNKFDESGNLTALPEDEAYEWVNTLNQTFVDAVRATGGNNAERILIVSGYWTNIDKTTSEEFKIPEDTAEDKLMVSVHYLDNTEYWIKDIGSERWREYYESQGDLLKEAFIDKGIPVFMGEVTSIYTEDHMASNAVNASTSDCFREIMEYMIDSDFVPVLWDVSDNFYSRTECDIITTSDKEMIADLAKLAEEKQDN